MNKLIILALLASFTVYGKTIEEGVHQASGSASDATKVSQESGTATNLTVVGVLKLVDADVLTNYKTTVFSGGTNIITKVYNGTTNTYYDLNN